MRGGVTRKLLTRRKVADLTREIGLGHGGSLNTRIKEFVRPALTSGSIRGAVRDYIVGGARKQRVVTKYGEISNWDVSNVTNMENMFELEGAVSFNHASFAPDSLISTQAPKKASPSRRRPPTARRSGSRCPRGRRPARRCTCACPWRCRRRSRKALPS